MRVFEQAFGSQASTTNKVYKAHNLDFKPHAVSDDELVENVDDHAFEEKRDPARASGKSNLIFNGFTGIDAAETDGFKYAVFRTFVSYDGDEPRAGTWNRYLA